MDWSIVIVLLIINAALGGQYLLNSKARQSADAEKADGKGSHEAVAPPTRLEEFSTAVMLAWWRELFKLVWSVIAVAIEAIKGRPWRDFWPGGLSLITISICSFTGIIENFGFYIIAKYPPHLWAPFINIYLLLLPIFTAIMFGSTVRKEHWIGTGLVFLGLAVTTVNVPGVPQLKWVLISSAPGSGGGHHAAVHGALDGVAFAWIVVINLCLCSQQLLNNKSVQLAVRKVSANAFVVWREIFKFGFATLALIIVSRYSAVRVADQFTFGWAVVFALGAGLTGYIYSWGFFVLSKYPAHLWVPYTTLYLVALPFLGVWLLPNVKVTLGQILGTLVAGGGLVVGLSDYSRHKIERITDKQG